MAMRQPAEYAEEIEREPTLPAGSGERFSGYGVMGLPFRSGHILGLTLMKRWTAGEQILVEEVWNGRLWSVRPVLVVDDRDNLLVLWSPKGSVRKVPTVPP